MYKTLFANPVNILIQLINFTILEKSITAINPVGPFIDSTGFLTGILRLLLFVGVNFSRL